MTDNNSEDVLVDNIVEKLDKIGSCEPPSYSNLIPVENSDQKALAGLSGNVKPTYVGHVSYCSDLECLVYEVQKERNHLLDKVKGKGVAISKKIIHSLRREYEAKYVFVGMRETGHILIIPVENFNKEWHTTNYDEQYYARLDEDVTDKIPDSMGNVFSKHPNRSPHSISKSEALERLND